MKDTARYIWLVLFLTSLGLLHWSLPLIFITAIGFFAQFIDEKDE